MRLVARTFVVTLRNKRSVKVTVAVGLVGRNIKTVDFDAPIRCTKGKMLSFNDQNETTKLVEEQVATENWWKK